jgi:hypothetical protein
MVVFEITVVEEKEVEVGVEAGMMIPGISRRDGCELQIVLVWWLMGYVGQYGGTKGEVSERLRAKNGKKSPSFRECYCFPGIAVMLSTSDP